MCSLQYLGMFYCPQAGALHSPHLHREHPDLQTSSVGHHTALERVTPTQGATVFAHSSHPKLGSS